jgi:succinate-semialdehyde dehydrogenase/glutarate-semialdehyde dehydrogenase
MSLINNIIEIEQCLIAGAWLSSDNGRTLSVDNPATGKELGRVPDCGQAETARAVAAAARVWPELRAMPAIERCDMLWRWRELVLESKEELARLMTQEQGKPLAEARGEIEYAASYLRWFAEEGRRLYGEVIPSPWRDRRILATREPVGVVGVITPWNFPSAMLARKVAPAIAAGCPVVVKPARQTPFSALALAELGLRAGIPNGALSVITGNARAIGAELTSNPTVRKVSFTGSTEIGKLLLAQCASTVKQVSMELGGNAPFLIFNDADLDKAVKDGLASKYRNSGQTCICVNRFYVQADAYEAFVAKLADAVSALRVGDGLTEGVNQGPLIDDKAVARVTEMIDDARQKGGRLVCGGKPHALGGNFFEPTVVADARQDMLVASQEIFGPVAPVFRFETEAEAIACANAAETGLAAYVYTKDLGRAWRVSEALEYGMVGVNESLVSTCEAPFGGVKESGLGREGARIGLEEYTTVKYTCMGGLGV